MFSRSLHLLVGGALLAANPAIGQAVVVPNGLEAVEGNTENSAPFHCPPPPSYDDMRYQQVYSGDEIGAGLLGEMRLRLQGGAVMNTVTGVTVTLSSTTAAPDALSSTFADNPGTDATVVFSGTLVFSSAASMTTPAPLDLVIPFQRSFPFDPAGGKNLLLDVSMATCAGGPGFDAESQPGDSVSRLYGGLSNSSGVQDTIGLVTQFHFHIFADGFESGDTNAWSFAVP